MIFRFLILSDEVDNFKREITIDSDDTFYDLYKVILECTGYSDGETASFFLCGNKWRKEKEITLEEMDTYSDEDSYVMDECVLNDFLEDEKQRLMFMFDLQRERALYMELSEIITGKNLKKGLCTLSEGNAPVQTLSPEETKSDSSESTTDESFFGDQDFNFDELDNEGFDGLDNLDTDSDEGDLS